MFLANVYGGQEKWDLVAEYYEKALEKSKDAEDTLRRALTFRNSGCTRLVQGQVEPAKDLLVEAYQLRIATLGAYFETANTCIC